VLLLQSLHFFKSRGFQKAIAVPLLFTAAGLFSLTDNDILNKHRPHCDGPVLPYTSKACSKRVVAQPGVKKKD
jgi:hypothetical protein